MAVLTRTRNVDERSTIILIVWFE